MGKKVPKEIWSNSERFEIQFEVKHFQIWV